MARNEIVIHVKAKDSASGVLGGIGKKFGALKLPAIAAGAAIVGIGIGAIKMAADFDKAFGEVTTLFDAPKAQVTALRTGVKDLAKEMGLDATEATKALYSAISAGVKPGNAIDFLRENAKLAIGGVTDLNTAVDLTTTVLNAFGLEQSRLKDVSDSMFTAVRLGKTTIDELGAALFNVAPVAAQMGVSVDEVSAALAVMTAKGVPTSVATTQLRQAILALAAPTKRQAKELKGLGLSFDADKIAAQGLAETFRQLIVAAAGDDEVLRRLVGSTEALQAVLALGTDGAQEFEAALAEMEGKSGATDAAFTKMNQTFDRQFTILKSQLKGIMLDIGEQVLPLLIRALAKLNPWLQEKIPKAIAFMKEKWVELQPHVEAFARFMQEDVIPVIQAVVAFIEDHWPEISAVVIAVMTNFKLEVESKLRLIFDIFGFFNALLHGEWSQAWQKLKDIPIHQMQIAKERLENVWRLIRALFGDQIFAIAGMVKTGFESARDFAIGAFEGMRDGLAGIWSSIVGTARGFINDLIGQINTLIAGVNTVSGLLNKLPGVSIGGVPQIPGIPAPAVAPPPGGGFLDLPGPLSFGHGGTVPGPRGAAQLAVVHGGETITPSSSERSPVINVFIEQFIAQGTVAEEMASIGLSVP